jgi:hypothetical protein
MKSYLTRWPDMRSHLCRRDTRHFRTFSTLPRMPIPTMICPTAYDLRSYCREDRGDWNGMWIQDLDPLGSYLTHFVRDCYAFLYEKRKGFLIRKELKARLIILIIPKKSDFNTLKNCISSSRISFSTPSSPLRTNFYSSIRKWVPFLKSGRCKNA